MALMLRIQHRVYYLRRDGAYTTSQRNKTSKTSDSDIVILRQHFFKEKKCVTRYAIVVYDDPSPFLVASYNSIFMYDDRVQYSFIQIVLFFFVLLIFICLRLCVVVLVSFCFSLPVPLLLASFTLFLGLSLVFTIYECKGNSIQAHFLYSLSL